MPTAPSLKPASLPRLVPLPEERPVVFADRAGSCYVSNITDDHRKKHGMYLTPAPVASFMAGMVQTRSKLVRLLDPAAGAGILLCAAVEQLVTPRDRPLRIEVTAYEIDPAMAEVLSWVLEHLATWAKGHGVEVIPQVLRHDFILEHGDVLQPSGTLFRPGCSRERFDIIVANPPYFKIAKSDPRALIAATVVHGQPNIYGLFMAVSAALLRPGGSMVYLTPRSFASGSYFRAFREWFFSRIRPIQIHVFGSRKDAFRRDEVLQENVILHGERHDHTDKEHRVAISTSMGASDILKSTNRSVLLGDILGQERDRVLRLAASDADASIIDVIQAWPGSLQKYGLAISTGPVVPFRATELIDAEGVVPGTHVPLVWMNHVTPMRVAWPISKKREYIKSSAADRGLLVGNRNYVLLRRFSAKEEKRRLVAAPYLRGHLDTALIGLENHLNYIHRPDGQLTTEEAWGLAALYNSSLLDSYFRTANGNTQVNATELRAMPLPSRPVIEAIGRKAARCDGNLDEIDALINEVIGEEITPAYVRLASA